MRITISITDEKSKELIKKLKAENINISGYFRSLLIEKIGGANNDNV